MLWKLKTKGKKKYCSGVENYFQIEENLQISAFVGGEHQIRFSEPEEEGSD